MSRAVSITKNNVDDTVEWTKENCPSYAGMSGPIHSIMDNRHRVTRYIFHFKDDNEALMFQLRWA